MSTPRQVAANRANAQKSTGPVTQEGKDASRANALTHGFTAAVVVPEQDRERVAQRVTEWCATYNPAAPNEEWLLEQAAAYSVRADRCREQEYELGIELARLAAVSWDDDRDAEAEEVAARLHSKPVRYPLAAQADAARVRLAAGPLAAAGPAGGAGHQVVARAVWAAPDLLGTPAEFRGPPWGHGIAPLGVVAGELEKLTRLCAEVLAVRDESDRAAAERCPAGDAGGDPAALRGRLPGYRRAGPVPAPSRPAPVRPTAAPVPAPPHSPPPPARPTSELPPAERTQCDTGKSTATFPAPTSAFSAVVPRLAGVPRHEINPG